MDSLRCVFYPEGKIHSRRQSTWNRCEVNYARLQGIEALKEQFEKTTFVCETDEYLPTYFSPPRDGSAEVDRRKWIIGWIRCISSGKG